MRIVVQRVKWAQVKILATGECPGAINNGLLCLVGIASNDTLEELDYCVRKCVKAKLWPASHESSVTSDTQDSKRSWALSAVDKDYDILVLSQFTLFGNLKKGNKPDFHEAMSPKSANEMFSRVVECFKKYYEPEKIKCGVFGTECEVSLLNDGPCTIIIEKVHEK